MHAAAAGGAKQSLSSFARSKYKTGFTSFGYLPAVALVANFSFFFLVLHTYPSSALVPIKDFLSIMPLT
jgi:hypothetical protein